MAGTLFIFAFLLLVVSLVHWIVTGRRRNGFYEVQAGLALFLGGMSAVAVRMWGVRESVDSWQTWMIPILASVVLGAVFLGFLALAHISQDLPPDKIKLLKRRREQVAQLSDGERSKIRSDIEACISDLERRGLVSEAEADRARGAELGALALRAAREGIGALIARAAGFSGERSFGRSRYGAGVERRSRAGWRGSG